MKSGRRIGLRTRDRRLRLGRMVLGVTMGIVQVGEAEGRSRCAKDFVLGGKFFEFALEALIVR